MGSKESLNIESKRRFTQALFKIGGIKFGSFKLTSGKMSSYYIDLRIVPSHPQIFQAAVQMYAATVSQLGLDQFRIVAGIPTSGLVYASALAYQIQKPLIYIRKKAKDWGSGHRIEGVSVEGATVVMVDDVLTTGKSVLEAAEAIRFEKGLAKYALVLVDREEGGAANLASKGIELHSPLRVGEMVDILFKLGEIGTGEKDAVLRQIGGQR
jgi:orotate phosphoribosyltransferase